MTNPEREQLTRRLLLAEHELTKVCTEVGALRRQCRRNGAIASGVGLVAVFATINAWSSATAGAQGSGPLTVKAPFLVVDTSNKPIFSVTDDTHRGVEIKQKDSRAFVQLWDEGASIRGPLAVTDSAEKAIVIVQDLTVTQAKDVKGVGQAVTSNRGLHVFNAKGDTVARLAVAGADGYVSARQGGQGSGLGGVQGALYVDKTGVHLGLTGTGNTQTVRLSGDAAGLQFFNVSGAALAELNRTHLWLGDAAGNGVVEAGILPDGRGVVRTGPRSGGPLGPGTLSLPFAIVGHK